MPGQWSGWPELRKEYTFSLVPAQGGNNGVYVGNTTINSNVLTGFVSTTGILSGYGVSGGSILTGAIVTNVTAGPNGTVTLNHQPEQEMDLAAEQFAREILTSKN